MIVLCLPSDERGWCHSTNNPCVAVSDSECSGDSGEEERFGGKSSVNKILQALEEGIAQWLEENGRVARTNATVQQ